MGGLDEPFLTREERDPDDVTASVKRKLIIGASLCFLFMLVEIVGGLVAHSIAIISDAAHMLSDVAGFLVGAMSLFLTSRAHDARYSFGYHRAEVLGAIASILIVWLMTGMLVYEAVKRMIIPEIVDGRIMFLVSVIGLVMNGVLMLVLGHDGHSHGGHGHSHGHGGWQRQLCKDYKNIMSCTESLLVLHAPASIWMNLQRQLFVRLG